MEMTIKIEPKEDNKDTTIEGNKTFNQQKS
jgi:hypothetical protein